MRTIKWSYNMLRTLREMYPHDTNTRIAATIGVGTRCVVAKAAELGLEKERDIRRKEAERILMENYGTHSQTELSRLTGLSLRTVKRMAGRLGLKRDADDASRFISSRRKEIIRRERLRLRIGLAPITNVKVTGNRRRAILRNRLKQYGYVVMRGNDTIFFSPDMARCSRHEDRGTSLGLTFLPLPQQQSFTTKII